MLGLFKKFFTKSNNTLEQLMLMLDFNSPVAKKTSYLRDGYIKNAIVRRCIDEISNTIAGIDLRISVKKQDGTLEPKQGHPLLEKLIRPNLYQSGDDLLQEAVTNYLYSGNLFFLKTGGKVSKGLSELYILPSDQVTVEKNKQGFPINYIHKLNGIDTKYPINPIDGRSDVLHIKNTNPIDKFDGLPLMASAEDAIAIINDGLRYNARLIQNGAKPSGLLQTDNSLSINQRTELQAFLDKFKGPEGAGKIPILENGLKWQQLGFSPNEMDYERLLNLASRYIASIFGVPFPLVIPDAATYENMKTAREALAQNTVVPLLSKICAALTNFLGPLYVDSPIIDFSLDDVASLESVRERKFDRMASVAKAGLLTINEARKELGYKDMDGGDILLVASSQIPLEMAGISFSDPATEDVQKSLSDLGYTQDEINKELFNLRGH